MTYYTSIRSIDSNKRTTKAVLRKVIVDENGKIVNRNPSKEELKGLQIEQYDKRCEPKEYNPKYTDKELLDYLKVFYEEYGRVPVKRDFNNNPRYPNFATYQTRFRSWSNALKLVGFDVESMVKKGVIETPLQKARLTEIMVLNHFKQHPVDLAGENCNSHCDGICPNGKIYDVKSSKFYTDKMRWAFVTRNKYKEEIEIYYLLAFNSDRTKLEYAWRIPGEIVESDQFHVGLNTNYEFNVKNMKEYDITDKFNSIW